MIKRTLVIAGLLFVCLTGMLCAAGCQDAAEVGAIACEGLEGKDRDHCIQQLAVTSGNLKLCDDIESAGPKSKCWLYIAKNTKTAGLCLAMKKTDWYGEQGAYDAEECLQYVARETNDGDVCQLLEEYKDSSGSDLNPDGVSREICISSIICGKSGQEPCYSSSKGKDGSPYWCMSDDGMKTYHQTPPDVCP